MKITKKELRKIIKEEILNERKKSNSYDDFIYDIDNFKEKYSDISADIEGKLYDLGVISDNTREIELFFKADRKIWDGIIDMKNALGQLKNKYNI